METSSARDDQSLASLLGGRTASIDATLPPVAFVAGWLLSGRSVAIGAVVAIVIGLAVAGFRLARGNRPRAVLIGLLGVCVAALIALYTGRAADFFLLQLASNGASALAWAISIVFRWPLLGVIVGLLLGQKTRWRKDRALMRAYSLASWIWVLQYVIRVAVFGVFYAMQAVVPLLVARVALSWPLIVLCLLVSGWVLRQTLPAGHPGFRKPQIVEIQQAPDAA
ncbi:DUF3159 domain-containing protein [Fodinicola feengrottensis]|uniref:DUF3159 domain-containing protein n=1 Tax=Fodinicola feengrottensis TaxID=435914 RepID=A0ABN2HE09_9ACTN|nr:DUF3159 domain-containing protein [Fodinicola feengrottensis]